MQAPVLEQIHNADNLPSLPMVVIDILNLTKNPNTSLEQISNVVQNDPVLVARILKMVNSSMFGVARKVTSIKQAVALLGLRSVKILALSFSLVDLIEPDQDSKCHFDFENYWRHSLTAAVAGRLLSEQTAPDIKDQAFIGGLLADIGMIAAQHCAPELYQPVLQKNQEVGYWDIKHEIDLLGISHADISYELLKKWGLSKTLYTAVKFHHGGDISQLDPDESRLTCILQGAAEITRLYCGDIDVTEIDNCQKLCIKLTGISEANLENLFDHLANYVMEIAELMALPISQAPSFDELQKQANDQLRKMGTKCNFK